MDNTDWTTTAQKNETTTQKKTLSGRKDRSKKKVEEYHVDPEKILKYTRGGGVKTKVSKNKEKELIFFTLINKTVLLASIFTYS